MSSMARPIVRLRHEGFVCAIPVDRVSVADRELTESQVVLRLWPAGAAASSSERAAAGFARHLCVATPRGDRWLEGRQMAVRVLDAGTVWQLPEVVRAALRMPYVVGLAQVDGGLAWVIDPERLPEVD